MSTNSRLRTAFAMVLLVAAGCGGSSKSPPEQPPPLTPGTPFTLSGTVTYDFVPATYDPVTETGTLAFSSATPRPVRDARVQVLQGAAGTVLAETTTRATGAYTITFTPGATGALVLAVLAESVTPSIRVLDNTDGTLWAVGKPIANASPTLNVHAPDGWNGTAYVAANRIAAPFAILDSMYTAARRFLDLPRTVAYLPLKVYWSPQNFPSTSYAPATGAIGTSHYSPGEKAIYILGKEGVDTDEFDSHVIVHEWGHYFEDNLSRADSPGGPHGGGDVLDPRLAFGEGYGNAIAAMLLPESIYADTLWSPPGGSSIVAFGFDAATVPNPTDDFAPSPYQALNPGPFSEMSVLRVLYHLYTGPAGLGPIYDTLVGPERDTDSLTTIASFVTGLKQQAGVDAAAVNTVLASRSIGPIADRWGTGDAKLASFFTQIPSLPYSSPAVGLEGGFEPNKWQANHYWVVTGTGGQLTVSATSTSDVGLVAFRQGNPVAQADLFTSGTETMRFSSVNGAKYVIVLTGYEPAPVNYTATLSVTSP